MKNHKNGRKAGKKFQPKDRIHVRGATAPSGRPHVLVSACRKKAWAQYAQFDGSGKEAREVLASQGIILLNDGWAELMSKVAALRDFPPKPLIEKAGWSKKHYALSDGTAFGGAGAGKSIVLFQRDKRKVRVRGTLTDWQKNVAEPLAEQYVASFALMSMFAAPLLRLMGRTSNFGFALAGQKGVGKTTAQYIASSVWGPAVSSLGSNFWVSAHSTVAGFESLMAEYDDMALVIEEANLFAAGETVHARSAKTHQRIFQLAEGAEKARHKSTRQRRSRFIWLTSTNEPLERIMAPAANDVMEAAADRELTIPISADRPFGLLDSVPEGYASASEFVDGLVQAVAKYYGQPIRAFLSRLAAERNLDLKALKQRIRKLVAKFRTAVQIDANSGSASRVAEAFGLVYAAGQLAKEYGALPASMRCLKAARVAYELNRALFEHRSPLDQLHALARRDGIIHFSDGERPDLTAKEVAGALGFVRTKKNGRRELIATRHGMSRVFADPSAFIREPEIKRLLDSDGGRLETKRRISSRGKPVRVYCFRLPEELD